MLREVCVQYVASPPGLQRAHSCNGPSRAPVRPGIASVARACRRPTTAVTDDVIALVRIRLRLDCAVDAGVFIVRIGIDGTRVAGGRWHSATGCTYVLLPRSV
jgi:hypothetical protein